MDWLPIAIFIVLGLILLIAEVIFIPGTTVVGILGFLSVVYGVYLSYADYGTTIGTATLLGSTVLSAIFFYWSFRNRSWERFSLKSTMTNKVNEEFAFTPEVGEKGLSISSIRPIGKAQFKDFEIEVRSNGGYINENVEIEVLRIEDGKVFVKPLN